MAAKRSTKKAQQVPRTDDNSQLGRVRRVCTAIPGVVERISHGEPTFFTPKRVFIMFANNHHNDGHIAMWIPAAPGVQESLIEEAPTTYFRPPYVGGSGWVGVELSKVNDEQLAELIHGAFRFANGKRTSTVRSKAETKHRG